MNADPWGLGQAGVDAESPGSWVLTISRGGWAGVGPCLHPGRVGPALSLGGITSITTPETARRSVFMWVKAINSPGTYFP